MSDYIHIVDVTNERYAYIGKVCETVYYLKAIYNMEEENVICLFGDESCAWVEDEILELDYKMVEFYEILGNTDNYRDINISKSDFSKFYDLIKGKDISIGRFRTEFDYFFKNRDINMFGMEEED